MNIKKLDNEKEIENAIIRVGEYRNIKPFPSRSTVVIQIILSILILSVPLVLSAKEGVWEFLDESNLMIFIHLFLLIILTSVLISIANYKFDLKNQAEKLVLIFPLSTLGFYGISLLSNYLKFKETNLHFVNVITTMSDRYLIMAGVAFSIYIFINAIKNTK